MSKYQLIQTDTKLVVTPLISKDFVQPFLYSQKDFLLHFSSNLFKRVSGVLLEIFLKKLKNERHKKLWPLLTIFKSILTLRACYGIAKSQKFGCVPRLFFVVLSNQDM